MKWTEKSVRTELPDIPVLFDNEIIPGMITGRQLDFAVVSFRNGQRTTSAIDVSWATLVKLLNNGAPLRA